MNHHIARWHSLTLSPADRAILDQMEEEMERSWDIWQLPYSQGGDEYPSELLAENVQGETFDDAVRTWLHRTSPAPHTKWTGEDYGFAKHHADGGYWTFWGARLSPSAVT